MIFEVPASSHVYGRSFVSEPKLSAVVTCYKDEPAIVPMHERLSRVMSSLGVDYEIIFVNDGSPDDSDAVLRTLTARDERVIAIEHARNFGSQNAFISGMQIATGDAVVLLDGDLQDPPELIAEFYQKWREGFEVVYGRRTKREGTPLLAFCARVFYRVFRHVSDISIPVDAGDFALMDRRVVEHLLGFPESDQFLRGLRAWVGFKQIGVDHVRPKRAFGRSTHNFGKNIWWAKKGILSFSLWPIEVLGYVAAAMTVLSFSALLLLLGDSILHPDVSHGSALVIAVISFFGSFNLFAVALVGEYVGKVLEESKRRPRFIRKAIRKGQEHLVTTSEIEDFIRTRADQPTSQRRPRLSPLTSHGS